MAEPPLPMRSNAAENSLRRSSRFLRSSSARLRNSSARLRNSSWYFNTKAPVAGMIPSMAMAGVTCLGSMAVRMDSNVGSRKSNPPRIKRNNMNNTIAATDQSAIFTNGCSDNHDGFLWSLFPAMVFLVPSLRIYEFYGAAMALVTATRLRRVFSRVVVPWRVVFPGPPES